MPVQSGARLDTPSLVRSILHLQALRLHGTTLLRELLHADVVHLADHEFRTGLNMD